MEFGKQSRFFKPAAWSACLAALVSSGCFSFVNSVPNPVADVVNCCKEVPCGGRSHVYVFLINGMDPIECGNLIGVRQYLFDLGFNNTWYGQFYHTPCLADEIRRIHCEDPCARVAIVGYGIGANMAQHMTKKLNRHNIDVDLQFYIGGTALAHGTRQTSENLGRIIHVQTWSCLGKGRSLAHADSLRLDSVPLCAAATNKHVLEVLTHELVELACSVPDKKEHSRKEPETAPTPKPLPASGAEAQSPRREREETNVLRPVRSLKMPQFESEAKKDAEPPSPPPPSPPTSAEPQLLDE